MTSCQKDGPLDSAYDNRSSSTTVNDGCNGGIYTYAQTPIPGNPNDVVLVDFQKVESQVSSITSDGDIKSLAKKLDISKFNAYERAYGVYYWITINIAYDYAMLDGEYRCDWQSSSSVLERKLGVCEGFANLFSALCKELQIPTVKIWGYVDPSDVKTRHAWNAMGIGGVWYLLDVTWDVEKKIKGRTYFMSSPQVFYTKHVPDENLLVWKLF
jgi:transglutaminase/protease-like cytokinesis protein 3